MSSVLGFVELGAIVLAWLILWNFLVKGFTANQAGHPAADGLAAIMN